MAAVLALIVVGTLAWAVPAQANECYEWAGKYRGIRACDTQVAFVQWPDGREEKFVIGTDGVVYHSYQRYFNDLNWGPWDSLGGVAIRGGVRMSKNSPLEIAVDGSDGLQWCKKWSGSSWSSSWYRCYGYWAGERPIHLQWGNCYVWAGSLYGTMKCGTNPAYYQWPDGTDEVFVTGQDGVVYHTRNSPGDPRGFRPWQVFGGRGLQGGVYVNLASPLEVAVLGGDGVTWAKNWANGYWKGWYEVYSCGEFTVCA